MASVGEPVYQIFSFQDSKYSPDPIHELPAQCLTSTPVPIVIDNGSFQTRAGWAVPGAFDSPRLVFRSVAARSRGAARSETQIGNDIPNLEPLRWLLKSQFDRNVVVNFEIQELICDYIFTHIGITSEVSIPILLQYCFITGEIFKEYMFVRFFLTYVHSRSRTCIWPAKALVLQVVMLIVVTIPTRISNT